MSPVFNVINTLLMHFYIAVFQYNHILLPNLNKTVMNGFEVLKHLQITSQLMRIPVVVFTTSSEISSIEKSYDPGANSYIVKPKTFPQLQLLVADLFKYWFNIVRLSPRPFHY